MNRVLCIALWLMLSPGFATRHVDGADKHALLAGVTVYKHSRSWWLAGGAVGAVWQSAIIAVAIPSCF